MVIEKTEHILKLFLNRLNYQEIKSEMTGTDIFYYFVKSPLYT